MMHSAASRAARILGTIKSNTALLFWDPERFGRNLLQVTNPRLFEQRLVDIMNAVPMHVRVDPAPDAPVRLNVLDSAWSKSGMTGGPNTVINLALRVAQRGIPVRLVSTVQAATIDPAWFRNHAGSLLGGPDVPEISIATAADPNNPLPLGHRDVFLATHWSTAQQLKPVLPQLPIREFFYMLQEFEPAFYPWSGNFALALETYGMDFWPIINEAMLADYLFSQPLGRLMDGVIRDRAVVFEPAVDKDVFFVGPPDARPRPKRLLFYARPTNTRNMFGLGLMALRHAAASPAFAGWEFLSIGSRGSVPDLQLGHGHVLRRAPWVDYAGYGDLLRQADLLFCPMLSPHTSYPVLEMAACGGFSVTNTFATKTQGKIAALSPNIIAVEPTLEGFAAGLVEAAGKVADGLPRHSALNMARDWAATLDPAASRVVDIIRSMQGAM